MGVVYAAHDEELDRPVAIKRMYETVSSNEEARRRFQREARSAARVRHPNVCQIYDIGEEGEELFLAMELLEGEPLSERVRRGALEVGEALEVSLGVLSALEALHRAGIVHRDLKPSNVFLTEHGVKLLDFGLAKELPDPAMTNAPTLSRITKVGMWVGTPHYMAPEQCRGETVDHRADLFAAGAILFEMLTGKRAFHGRTPLEVFHSVLYEQPPALRGSPAVDLVDRALRRAMSKRAEDRPQSAAALAAELRSALAVTERGDAARAHVVTRLMVLPLRVLKPDPDTDFLAFSIADAVASGLSGLQPLLVRSSAAAARYADGIPDLERIAGEAEVDVVLVGTLVRAGNQIRVSVQLLEARTGTLLWSDTPQVPLRDVFELQDQIVARIVDSLSLSISTREKRLLKHDVPASPSAYEYYLRGNQIAAQGLRGGETLQVARELYQRSVDEDGAYAPAWARLGRCHWLVAKGIKEGGEEELVRAESCFHRALELNPELPLAHNLYAHFLADRGLATEGLARLLKRAQSGAGEPELFAALVQLCRFCGLPEASMAAHERVRRLDPQISTSANHTLWQLGEYSRSLREMNKGTFYLDALILAMQGRKEEAHRFLREREASSLAPVTQAYVASLRALLEGSRDESLRATEEAIRYFRDPEGRFYLARHFGYWGVAERALEALQDVVAHGFLPHRLATDEWLRSVRGNPRFGALVREVESRRRENASIFSELGGKELLGAGSGKL